MEGKFNENYLITLKTVSRGQNDLIGEFKITADGRVCYEVRLYSNRN